ncbi:dihydroxyacetone kinase subunit DhaL [Microbispora siamensis]|uniref:Erythrulose kinase n=1 Tax=Microbispora siamensis TaxID=564413 RepID=A0ABQ4GRQ8_9ACTN|nr:dihydroxyacetone kinase subunit DhaL [Microbispora siamensis]GIH64116.1 erythrulose kinase [Microbispora siamensis]
MTFLYDDPERFKDDVIDGFAAAYARYASRVPGASGFVRNGGPRQGKVSLVVGGGSGHYPSYAGIVGRGLADGCVLGDVFTSPSAEQVYRVARAADGGAGIVLAFGNYAGDRLNFAAARERLIAGGVDTRIVYVTDDIASAGPGEKDKRRGIAGTATVYKIGGAAADSGYDLDAVERVMAAANDATYSYGVAFGGCTLPGRKEPLFTVTDGQMEFGLGIHGEPGVRSAPWMPAADLATALVSSLLEERPASADGRVAVIVNGLGATKYEELLVLYGHVDRLLHEAGLTLVLPEVGELVTSLDMAGCSVSLTWLDDELEALWAAPVDTASLRRGAPSGFPSFEPVARADTDDHLEVGEAASTEVSRQAATTARQVLAAMTDAVIENEERLGRMDAVAGDGDHGTGMVRGMKAALSAAQRAEHSGIGSVLRAAGDAFGDRAGGTSGILWGILLTTVGVSLGDTEAVTPERLATALRDGAETVQRIGKAQVGDKTLLDALFPFVASLESAVAERRPVAQAWAQAADEAVRAAAATANLVAGIGRARPLAERSLGTPDPGAVSMGIVLTAAADALKASDTCNI